MSNAISRCTAALALVALVGLVSSAPTRTGAKPQSAPLR